MSSRDFDRDTESLTEPTDALSAQKPSRVSFAARTVSDPTWDPIHSTIIHKLDCRHVDMVRKIATHSFPQAWETKDFAYFLSHPSSHSYGLFHRQFDSRKAELQAYFIGFLVKGDLDIISIATRPDHRRKGYAESVMRYVRSLPNVRRVFLEVDKENAAALKLYTKIGFEIVGQRKKYYENKRDAFVMRWQARSAQSKFN
jgi:[ribosomal protein S18]-alanine N-acetyltransferase